MKNWLTRNWNNILICIFLLIIICIIYYCVRYKWDSIKDDFFKINLTNILQIISTLLVALFFSSIVTEKNSNNSKLKEIAINLIEEFNLNIKKIFELSTDYIKKPDEGLKKKINISFQESNYQLEDLKDLQKDGTLKLLEIDEQFENKYLRFHQAVTGSPFGDGKPKYDVNNKKIIYDTYHILSKGIICIRCNLYKR
jgi:uncharacterized protein YacL